MTQHHALAFPFDTPTLPLLVVLFELLASLQMWNHLELVLLFEKKMNETLTYSLSCFTCLERVLSAGLLV
jgi:hypothetical protein